MMRLGGSLKGVDRQGAHVPGTALWLKLNVMGDGTTLEIKKRDLPVYINIFCLDGTDAPRLLNVVQGQYDLHSLGVAKRPTIGTWIHSIPVGHHLLRENEVLLCQKLTVAFFWATYAQRMKKQNPLN
ncbi:hypothetical protein ACQ86N_26435 [Puia sp. P3]|uniref:hypothetical protein n=1 Tax=Puia sp. P3 TaxID=3423952 RepID=UPI003D67373F